MKVLVINSGSSSLKYQLLDTSKSLVISRGLVEKIGGDAEYSFYDQKGEKICQKIKAGDHTQAFHAVIKNLEDKQYGFIYSLKDINAIGHRVVHGGEGFSRSVIIDDTVIKGIEKYSELAPLHNPANLAGIKACREILPDTPEVAVFDTAFHQTMPIGSYLYALPYEYYKDMGIRRYGFHGTSHRYVTLKTARFLGKKTEDLNIISCHLGNGSSITAVKNGKSVDTSMGFTPLEGVVMGTRCGSIDPAILTYLMEKLSIDSHEMNAILNKKSGLLGLSGLSNDLREIKKAAQEGNKQAQSTREVLVKSIRRYIGAYMVELGRVDAIVFTAGIGENDWDIREKAVAGLEDWGIDLDEEINKNTFGELKDLTKKGSKVKVLMVPTNEELMIALETVNVVEGKDEIVLPQ